jgi:multidrug efflux pump subunit AcrB
LVPATFGKLSPNLRKLLKTRNPVRAPSNLNSRQTATFKNRRKAELKSRTLSQNPINIYSITGQKPQKPLIFLSQVNNPTKLRQIQQKIKEILGQLKGLLRIKNLTAKAKQQTQRKSWVFGRILRGFGKTLN